ncbi:MAG: Imm17 family immunity protein [Dysgonomonas sp.]|nr:Imm17 family immunity protein [Dysgonomonas sp.]
MLDNVKAYFEKNPAYFGIVIIALGIVLFISAIKGAKWLFDNEVSGSTYSLGKIDGWINMFGKKTARVIVAILSVVLVVAGVVWIWAYL